MKYCNKCRAQNEAESKFCSKCGNPFNIVANQSQNTTFNQPVQNMNVPNYNENNYYNGNLQNGGQTKSAKPVIITCLVVVLLIVAGIVVVNLCVSEKVEDKNNDLDTLKDITNINSNLKDVEDLDFYKELDKYLEEIENLELNIKNEYESDLGKIEKVPEKGNEETENLLRDVAGNWVNQANECYRFDEDGTFYWYKSNDDKSDNYYRGTYNVVKADDAIKALNLEEKNVNEMIVRSAGKVTREDIYCIKAYPNYLISGGIDKSETGINPNMCFTIGFLRVSDTSAEGYNYVTESELILTKTK